MNKKLLVAVTALGIYLSTFSMELEQTQAPAVLGFYLSTLPLELRRYIVYLSLRAEVETQYELTQVIETERGLFFSLPDYSSIKLSPDGKTLLFVSGYKAILFDMEKRAMIMQLKEDQGLISSVALSPNGETVLTGASRGISSLWDARTGKKLKSLKVKGLDTIISEVTFSQDGKMFLAKSGNKIVVYLCNSEKKGSFLLGGKNYRSITSVAFSPDSKSVLIGSSDSSASLINILTKKATRRFTGELNWFFSEGHTDEITSVAFSPDGKTILTGSKDATARLWNVDTGRVIKEFKKHTDSVKAYFNPNGKTIITCSEDGGAHLWDINTGEILQNLINHTEPLCGLTYNKDGRIIIIGTDDGVLFREERFLTFSEEKKQKMYSLFIKRGLYSVLSNKFKQENKKEESTCPIQ